MTAVEPGAPIVLPNGPQPHAQDTPPPLRVGMLVYPMMTLLDLAGPQATLGMHGETYLAWKTRDPVTSDSGVTLLPTHTFDDCPTDLDVLFVPGGAGTHDWMEDDDILAFLRRAASGSDYVTSVCSGALLLAAAGLLDGYQATTHWAVHDVLAAMGVAAVRRRVVIDRDRMTGGGVTAGIDFGLTLLARLRGETVAKTTQLALEYDPKPPFAGGTPETTEPEIVAAIRTMGAPLDAKLMAVVDRMRVRASS